MIIIIIIFIFIVTIATEVNFRDMFKRRIMSRIQICKNIQGAPFKIRKLMLLPVKPEAPSHAYISQKVVFVAYYCCTKVGFNI